MAIVPFTRAAILVQKCCTECGWT